jgi:hypothetical protein
VQDNQFAVTQVASNALLVLPDSSEVAIGQSTTIQVGAITGAAAATPKAVTLVAGTLRFSVKHPAGQQSSYVFQGSNSQLAIRGTVGLYSSGPNGDVITCLLCDPGDATVTAGGTSQPLLTGQTATIAIGGVITIAATTAILVGAFSSAGLSTSATSASGFASGIGGATGAAAGAAGTTTAIAVGAAAAVAAGVAVATSNSSPTPAAS